MTQSTFIYGKVNFIYFSISSRYLKKRYGTEIMSDMLMAVSQCLNFLPTMATPFRAMMN